MTGQIFRVTLISLFILMHLDAAVGENPASQIDPTECRKAGGIVSSNGDCRIKLSQADCDKVGATLSEDGFSCFTAVTKEMCNKKGWRWVDGGCWEGMTKGEVEALRFPATH